MNRYSHSYIAKIELKYTRGKEIGSKKGKGERKQSFIKS
uniref:Arm-DNA-bind_5 domain-containing protein n=1 Tax=Taenia asiatica TaxID=60517 RepID=A0A0R3W4U6_TAEAS